MGKKLEQVFELHLCVDEQYSNTMTSTHNHRNLLENLRKFIIRVTNIKLNSKAWYKMHVCFSVCYCNIVTVELNERH